MINTKLINERRRELNMSWKDLSDETHMNVNTLRSKVYNNRPMTVGQAMAVQNALDIPDERFKLYFSCCETKNGR